MLQNRDELLAASRPQPMVNVNTLGTLPYAKVPDVNPAPMAPPVSASPLSPPINYKPLTGSEPDGSEEPQLAPLMPASVLKEKGFRTDLKPLVSARAQQIIEEARMMNQISSVPKLLTADMMKNRNRDAFMKTLITPAAPETPEETEGSVAWFARRGREGAKNVPGQVLGVVADILSTPWYVGAMVEGSWTGKSEGYWYEAAKGMKEGVANIKALGAPERDPDQTTVQKLYDPGIVIPMIADFGSQIVSMFAGGGAAVKGLGLLSKGAMSVKTANMIGTAAGGIWGGYVEGQNTYFEAIEKGMTPGQASVAFAKHAAISGALSMSQLSFLMNQMPAVLQQKMLRRVVAGGWDAWTETLDETAGAWSLDPDLDFKEAFQITKDAFGELGTASFIVGMLTGNMGLPPEMALKAASANAVQSQINYAGEGKSVMDQVGEERLKGILEGEATYFRTVDGVRHSTMDGKVRGGIVEGDSGYYWIPGRYGNKDGELLPIRLSDIVEVGTVGENAEDIVTHGSEQFQRLKTEADVTTSEIFGPIPQMRTKTFEDAYAAEREIAIRRIIAESAQKRAANQEAEFERFTAELGAAMQQREAVADNVRGVENAVRSGMPEIGPDAPVAGDIPADIDEKMFAQLDKIAEAEWQGKLGTARWLGLSPEVRKQKKRETARRLAGLTGSVTKLQGVVSEGIQPAAPGTFAAEVEAMIANHALTGVSTPIDQLLEEDYVAKAVVEAERDIQAKLRYIDTVSRRISDSMVEDSSGNTYGLSAATFGPVAGGAPQALSVQDVETGADTLAQAKAAAPLPSTAAETVDMSSGDWTRVLLTYSGSENMMEMLKTGETTVEEVMMQAYQNAGKLKFVPDSGKKRLIATKGIAGQTDERYNASMMSFVRAVREAKTALHYVMENEYAEDYGLRDDRLENVGAMPPRASAVGQDTLFSAEKPPVGGEITDAEYGQVMARLGLDPFTVQRKAQDRVADHNAAITNYQSALATLYSGTAADKRAAADIEGKVTRGIEGNSNTAGHSYSYRWGLWKIAEHYENSPRPRALGSAQGPVLKSTAPGGKTTRRRTVKSNKSAEAIHGFAATMKRSNLYHSLVKAGSLLGWDDHYATAEIASEIVYAQANAQVAAGVVKTVSEYYDKYLGDLVAEASVLSRSEYDIRKGTLGYSIPSEMLFSVVPGMTAEKLMVQLNETMEAEAIAKQMAASGLFPHLSVGELWEIAEDYTNDFLYTNIDKTVEAAKSAESDAIALQREKERLYKDLEAGVAFDNPPTKYYLGEEQVLEILALNFNKTNPSIPLVVSRLQRWNLLSGLPKEDLEYHLQQLEGKSWGWTFSFLKDLSDAEIAQKAAEDYKNQELPKLTHAEVLQKFEDRLKVLEAQQHFRIWVGSPERHKGAKLPKSRDMRFNLDGTPRVWFYATDYVLANTYGWLDTKRTHPFFHFGSYQASDARRPSLEVERSRIVPLVTNMANAYVTRDAVANNPYLLMQNLLRDNGITSMRAVEEEMAAIGYDMSTQQKTAASLLEHLGYDGIVYFNEIEGRGDTERDSLAALIPNTVKSVYHKDIPYVDGMNIMLSSVEDQVLGAFDPASKDIELFLGSDLHTVLHEFAHAWRRSLSPEQLSAAGKWAHGKGWKAGDAWTVKGEERFADGFVAWAGDSSAKVPKELEDVFEASAKYLSSIYSTGRALRPDVKTSAALSNVMEKIITKQLLRSANADDREEGRRRKRTREEFSQSKTKDLGDHIDMMAEFLNVPPQSARDKAELVEEMYARKRNPKYREELDQKLLEWEESGNPAIDLVDFLIVRDRAIEIRVKFENDFRDAYRKGPEAVNKLIDKMSKDRTHMDVRFYRMVAGDAGRRLQLLTNKATQIDTAVLLASVEKNYGSKSFDVLFSMMQDPKNAWNLADKMAGEMAPTMWDLYMQAYYGFRLSSPDVLAVNFFGTGLWTMWNYSVHRPFAGAIDLGFKAMSNITSWGKVLDRFYFRGNPRTRDHFNTSVLPLYAQLGRSVPYGTKLAKEIILDKTGGVHTLASVKNMDITTRDVNSWQRFTMRREGVTAKLLRKIFGASKGDMAIQKWEDTIRTLGPITAAATTFMRASDMMFKVIAVEGEMNRIAQEEAAEMFPRNPTAQAGWIKTRTASIVNDPGQLTPAQAERLSRVAEYNTFTDMPMKASRYVLGFRESLPIVKLVFPYFNTLVNLGKRGLEMVPGVGLGMEAMYRTDPEFQRNSYGHTKADIIAKQLEGAMFIAGVFLLLDDDELTGAAPEDPQERKHFYEAGKLEYAMKLGDTWYSYANIQPFNIALGMTANVRKYALANLDKLGSDSVEVQEKVTRDLMQAAWSVGSFMLNNDFMRSFEQYATAKTAERRAKVLGSTIESALIPYNGFLRWAMRTEKMMQNEEGYFVQQERDTLSETAFPVSHKILNSIFGLPSTESDKLTVWGEPYHYADNKWYDTWLPVQYSKGSQDNVDKILEELQYMPELPSRTYDIDKRGYQYDREIWQQLALGYGAESKPKLARLVESPGFQRKHKEDKVVAIQALLKDVRDKHVKRAKAAQRRAGLKPTGEEI